MRRIVITLVLAAASVASAAEPLVDQLRKLPALTKPHYSWPCGVHCGPGRDAWVEYARITHSIGLSVNHARRGVCEIACDVVRLAQERYPAGECVLNLNYSPWLPGTCGLSVRQPEQFGPEIERELVFLRGQLSKIKAWLDAYNAKHKSAVRIGAILLDSESLWPQAGNRLRNAAVDTRHNLIYLVCRTELPGVRIEMYGRGRVNPTQGGWSESDYFTGQELGDSFAVSLYRVFEPEVTREQFRRTVQRAKAAGVAKVTPWIALGAGYCRHREKFQAFSKTVDYDTVYDYQLGRDVHRDGLFEAADAVAFYPAPFNHPGWAEHFIAYCQGAAAVRALEPLAPRTLPPRTLNPERTGPEEGPRVRGVKGPRDQGTEADAARRALDLLAPGPLLPN